MARRPSRHPTELELEILKVLWRDGPLPVRAVRDALAPVRNLAYTSVMTIMNIMFEKGYVKRSRKGKGYAYRAAITERATSRRMLRDLVDRLFDGSAAAAMVNLMEAGDLGGQELKRLRTLIDQKAKESLQ